MNLKQRVLWVALLSMMNSIAFAQYEPDYVPNTAPAAPDTLSPSSMPHRGLPSPRYATPLEANNSGRPASSDNDRPMIGAPSAELPVYLYTQFGTEGVGVGYGMRLNPSWVIRAEANMMNYSKTSDKSGISSDMKLKLRSEGVYADYYPMENGIRLTGGLMLNQTEANYTAVAPAGGATATFNGTNYALTAGESVSGKVEASPVMPYLGIGYGHEEADRAGFKFHADLGIAFGKKPDTTLSINAPSLAANPTLEADRQAQEKTLQDDMKVLRALPVVKVGVGYTW